MKQPKLQRLQNPSQTNGEYMNNVRHEINGTFGRKEISER
jgi:hypothetical protein